jgi:hypothetical protein
LSKLIIQIEPPKIYRLVDAGLIEENAKGISEYLKSRTPGQGVALPTSSLPQGVDELFKGFNTKVSSLKQTTALEILGNPRETYDIRCQEITNAELSKHMARASVGPFVAYGLKPAVESFKEDICEC